MLSPDRDVLEVAGQLTAKARSMQVMGWSWVWLRQLAYTVARLRRILTDFLHNSCALQSKRKLSRVTFDVNRIIRTLDFCRHPTVERSIAMSVHILASRWVTAFILTLLGATFPPALHAVKIPSCDQVQNVSASLDTVLTLDIGSLELMLHLGLEDRVRFHAGTGTREQLQAAVQKRFQALTAQIPIFSSGFPSFESILVAKPDLVIGGWNYGFNQTTGVTPQRLSRFGIQSYVLEESCIHVQPKRTLTLDTAFADLEHLAQVFAREERVHAQIASWKSEIQALKKPQRPPKVFVYDSGQKIPFTGAGRAMINLIIQYAGGVNIFEGLAKSWVPVSWEEVLKKKPDVIIIINYGGEDGQRKKAFLEDYLQAFRIPAIAKQRILILPYADAVPGVRFVASIKKLHKAFKSWGVE